MEMEDRRQYPRRPLIGMVDYVGSPGVRCLSIRDISYGGLRLEVNAPESPGAKVSLSLLFPGSEDPVATHAQVVWGRQAAPFEVGLRFLELDEACSSLLRRMVEDQDKENEDECSG
jgi:hypothetical protein